MNAIKWKNITIEQINQLIWQPHQQPNQH